MGLFSKFEFGKKKESANPAAEKWQNVQQNTPYNGNTVSKLQPEMQAEQREKQQMERQQRKIVAGMLYDMKYMNEPDIALPSGARGRFDLKIRTGEIDDNVESAFLKAIQSPIEADGAETVNREIGGDLHYRRAMGYMLYGENGFRDPMKANNPGAVEEFMRVYPTPVEFKTKSEEMLRGIRRGSGEAKYQQYVRDMENFQRTIYGKRYEYYKSFEDMKEKATEDMVVFVGENKPITKPRVTMPAVGGEAMRMTSTERYDGNEREKIMREAVIDGDPFLLNGQKYMLSVEALRNLGLEPQEKMVLEGREIGLSGHFKIGNRDAVLGYVRTDNGYKVRGYYRSNSQGTWRYLPDYVTDGGTGSGADWYGKGYTEEMTTLPSEMQKTLSEIAEKEQIHVEQKTSPEFVLVGTAKVWNSKDEYREALHNHRLRGDIYQEINPRPEVNFGQMSNVKNAPESINIPGAMQPNFEKSEMEWDSNASLYGHLKNRVYESYDKKLKYTMSEDDWGRCFVSNIEAGGKVTSCGVRSEWVSGGDVVTPLYEYASQDGGYGDKSDVRRGYRCMWKGYLSKMKMIQDYLKSRK